MKRRSFFKRLAPAVAIIALAPRLAFRVPEERFFNELDAWFVNAIEVKAFGSSPDGLYDFIMTQPRPTSPIKERIDAVSAIPIARLTPMELEDLFRTTYKLKAKRHGHTDRQA